MPGPDKSPNFGLGDDFFKAMAEDLSSEIKPADLDAMFNAIGEDSSHEERLLADVTAESERVSTEAKLLLNVQFSASDLYPGGKEAFEIKFRPLLVVALQKFQESFHPITDPMTVCMEGHTSAFSGAVQHYESFGQNLALQMDNFFVAFSRLNRLVLSGDTDDISTVLRTLWHEFGHYVYGTALPSDTILQELSSCFVERFLLEKNISFHTDRASIHKFLAPQVTIGEEGWGMPPFACLPSALCRSMYHAWLQGWVDVFSSFDNIRLGLEKSLALSKNRGEIPTSSGKSFRPLPSLDEWLTNMDQVVPGVKQRYLSSPVFSKNIPAGDRAIWIPHSEWGGELHFNRFEPNVKFSTSTKPPDLHYGVCSLLPGAISVGIPALQKSFSVPHEGMAGIDPTYVRTLYSLGSENIAEPAIGDAIQIMYRCAGINKTMELTWDEKAANAPVSNE